MLDDTASRTLTGVSLALRETDAGDLLSSAGLFLAGLFRLSLSSCC